MPKQAATPEIISEIFQYVKQDRFFPEYLDPGSTTMAQVRAQLKECSDNANPAMYEDFDGMGVDGVSLEDWQVIADRITRAIELRKAYKFSGEQIGAFFEAIG